MCALLLLRLSGFDLTAVLTGLGLGGVAIAFAAQKTLEHLLGGIMVISDKPIQVGDFCRAGEFQGVVEDIGLRSTRLRTLDRTVVSIPNGQLATMSLENFTLRDRIRFRHVIGLRYETAADQLRYVLAEIRRLLYEHSKVDSQDARVRFVAFGHSSLDVEILAYVMATDFAVFLAIQEDLLLRIMDIIEAGGTSVAFPSQTMYVVGDSGLNREKSRGQQQGPDLEEHSDLPFQISRSQEIPQFKGTIGTLRPAPPSSTRAPRLVLGAAMSPLDTRTSSPLGATVADGGVNFSLFSRSATSVELLFFDRENDTRPARVVHVDSSINRTYHYWHVFVPGVELGQIYGYRVEGPFDPARGMRFDRTKVLLDPYGRGVVVPKITAAAQR